MAYQKTLIEELTDNFDWGIIIHNTKFLIYGKS